MKEKDIQNDIMKYLQSHPKVVWAYVTTTGTLKVKRHGGSSWITIGFIGMSDILGQLTDGRILAIEVKLPGKMPTEEQLDFIETVNNNNGLAFWVDSVKGVINELERE